MEVPFHSENVAQLVPALVSCAAQETKAARVARITTSTEGRRASSTMVLPVILDSILDAVEFQLTAHWAWVSFQLSLPYRRVDVTEEFHRRMRFFMGVSHWKVPFFRSLNRAQEIVTRWFTGALYPRHWFALRRGIWSIGHFLVLALQV